MHCFETRDSFISPMGPQIKYSEIIQGFGKIRASLQRSLQVLIGMFGVVGLGKHHC